MKVALADSDPNQAGSASSVALGQHEARSLQGGIWRDKHVQGKWMQAATKRFLLLTLAPLSFPSVPSCTLLQVAHWISGRQPGLLWQGEAGRGQWWGYSGWGGLNWKIKIQGYFASEHFSVPWRVFKFSMLILLTFSKLLSSPPDTHSLLLMNLRIREQFTGKQSKLGNVLFGKTFCPVSLIQAEEGTLLVDESVPSCWWCRIPNLSLSLSSFSIASSAIEIRSHDWRRNQETGAKSKTEVRNERQPRTQGYTRTQEGLIPWEQGFSRPSDQNTFLPRKIPNNPSKGSSLVGVASRQTNS